MSRRGAILALAACVALPGCVVEPGPPTELRPPSRADFAFEAGPILDARCADHACHGNPVRPFALYGVGRRRLAAADRGTPRPLTAAELDANHLATLGFIDAKRAVDTLLVRKALGIGGLGGHAGGAVFEAPSDPECRALARWIDGEEP